MNNMQAALISYIRKFNRFYTNILGLLDKHLLDSEFSLSEVRILYEIGHTEKCTAKKLIEKLRIDTGYVSRIIKHFEKQNFIYRTQSAEDGRLFYLYLTSKGEDILLELDGLSDRQIYEMIKHLSEHEQKSIAESMMTIENSLSKKKAPEDKKVKIRYELRPGDIGYLIHMHGWIYAEECGYNHIFEGYVCKTFYDFMKIYSPEKDRIWIAESEAKIVGAIAIVGHSEKRAQLRWFILHPASRGIGLGKTLLAEAIRYCHEKGYEKVFLDTTEDQKTAINMYVKEGFIKVAEHENNAWGKKLIEQTYELNL